MKSRRFRLVFLIASFAAPLALLLPESAHATAGGGQDLPWNAPLQTIIDNLTGPTARVAALGAAIVAIFTLLFGREDGMARTVAKVVLLISCLVGLPSLMQTLGLNGATAHPDSLYYVVLAAPPCALLVTVLLYRLRSA